MRVAAPQAMLAVKAAQGGHSMSARLDADHRSMPLRLFRRWAAAAALVLALAAPASAQIGVDLQLALMVDASGSVNQYRFELQKRGYVDAFRNPRVLAAIMGGRTQS